MIKRLNSNHKACGYKRRSICGFSVGNERLLKRVAQSFIYSLIGVCMLAQDQGNEGTPKGKLRNRLNKKESTVKANQSGEKGKRLGRAEEKQVGLFLPFSLP